MTFQNLRLSKKGVIPHSMRDLLSLIMSGDAGSESGMTVLIMTFLIERPFWTASRGWLSFVYKYFNTSKLSIDLVKTTP